MDISKYSLPPTGELNKNKNKKINFFKGEKKMKKMRKLIPALAMLLISAVMMSTASFAWFSMNTEVSATGMQVVATTSKNLVISANGNDWSNSASLSDSNSYALIPASVNCTTSTALAAGKFYTTYSNAGVDYGTGALGAATKVKVATNDADNEIAYYEKSTVYIKVDGTATDSFSKLYVSDIDVTRASTTSDISKALRVAVTVTQDSTSYTYIYAPVTDAEYLDGKSVSGMTKEQESDSFGTPTLTAQTITSVNDANATLGAVAQTNSVQVDVYVWYEGNDKNCTSANSVTTEGLTIDIKFAAE